jgi:glutathione S-transferase
LDALEALLARSAGTFCVGEAVSWADCCLVPQLFFCERFEMALDAWPTAVRVAKQCGALPAFATSHPLAQPDAPR